MGTLAFKEQTSQSQRRPAALAVCRVVDSGLAAVGLVVSAPLLLAACLAIRLESRGPAIFRQRRLGRGKRPFTLHKLRTMRVEADPETHREYVEQLINGDDHAHSNGDGRNLYKLAADDRVTRVGRFLRQTSLDELPQLYDVLRGHMSLVGPRPVIPYEAELYPSSYDRRFDVKPGLTGLWQVSGRNERTYHEMVALDIDWVERHSLRLYVSILARTPSVLLRRRGVA
jgi:lipopolysaccharide/colanic/teichoic acid biosynthesis glycosyltransferase